MSFVFWDLKKGRESPFLPITPCTLGRDELSFRGILPFSCQHYELCYVSMIFRGCLHQGKYLLVTTLSKLQQLAFNVDTPCILCSNSKVYNASMRRVKSLLITPSTSFSCIDHFGAKNNYRNNYQKYSIKMFLCINSFCISFYYYYIKEVVNKFI